MLLRRKQTTVPEIWKVLLFSSSSFVATSPARGRCLCMWFCFSISSATPLMLAVPKEMLCARLLNRAFRVSHHHHALGVQPPTQNIHTATCVACVLFTNVYTCRNMCRTCKHPAAHVQTHSVVHIPYHPMKELQHCCIIQSQMCWRQKWKKGSEEKNDRHVRQRDVRNITLLSESVRVRLKCEKFQDSTG